MWLPFYDSLADLVNKAPDTIGLRLFPWPLMALGLVLLFLAYALFPAQVAFALSIALFLAPIWLPFLLIAGAFTLWLVYIRSEFIASRPYVLLEIKLPRNVEKTPLAMESVFSSIHYTKGESNWFQIYWQGQVRPYWSFEIASLGGEIHFYVWTRADFRKLIENAFYAQYPGVQLVESVDYTRTITAEPGEYGVWGCDYRHTSAIDALPIKTYVEYGLDKPLKEYEQIDPFAHITEFLGSVGKHQQFWLQFIIRIHGGEKYNMKNKEGKTYTWRDQALEEVDKIRRETTKKFKYFDAASGKMIETEGFPNPTKGQMETIAAIERNTAKLAFDVGGRGVYIAKPEHFNPTFITGMINLFKPFSSENWNGIKATHFGIEFSDYPWEFGNRRRKDARFRQLVEAYRRRQYFHEPFKMDRPMVMSTEELATIYHIPSAVVVTPGIRRIQSPTAEAPPGLPV